MFKYGQFCHILMFRGSLLLRHSNRAYRYPNMTFISLIKNVTSKKVCRNLIVVSFLTALCASSANANLIINGGFEEPTGSALGGGGGWKYYDSANVAGWDGSNLELWGTLGITSYEGDYHAELNSHGQSKNTGAWSISQTFNTVAGQTYDLFFAYGARLGNASGSVESFSVEVDGLFEILDDHVVGTWNTHTDTFVADSDTATLTFSSVAQRRWTYGNFLDDIRITAVSEPSSIVLLLLGFIGLGVMKRKAKKLSAFLETIGARTKLKKSQTILIA